MVLLKESVVLQGRMEVEAILWQENSIKFKQIQLGPEVHLDSDTIFLFLPLSKIVR